MNTKIIKISIVMITALTAIALAQSESSYEFGPAGNWGAGDNDGGGANLVDPSRLKINHAMSFYAGGTSTSNVQSQSMYSTLIRYHFDAPVVLSLNFNMPIHSTFNQFGNFTEENLQSLDYFRNMPIDAAISWMPSDRFMLGLRVIKAPEGSPFYGYNPHFGGFGSPLYHRHSPFHQDGLFWTGSARHDRARDW